MKDLKKVFVISCCVAFYAVCFSVEVAAQRDRVVKSSSSQPTNLPPAETTTVRTTISARPTLTNDIKVVKNAAWEPQVQKTATISAVVGAAALAAAGRTAYGGSTSILLEESIRSLYGIPYRYGATGPSRYDCSGFVWAAFQKAGVNFTRSSARALWAQSEPVTGDDRFKFGTLVFLNGLGHMGIVADETGFYHASSSKGITFSPFKGYWSNRVVGFRRLKE